MWVDEDVYDQRYMRMLLHITNALNAVWQPKDVSLAQKQHIYEAIDCKACWSDASQHPKAMLCITEV